MIPMKHLSSSFKNNNKLHVIHFTTSLFGINRDPSNLPRPICISASDSSDSREKGFRTIYSLIKGEITVADGFDTSHQHRVFDRGKSSYESIALLSILLNASDNTLACVISSSSI